MSIQGLGRQKNKTWAKNNSVFLHRWSLAMNRFWNEHIWTWSVLDVVPCSSHLADSREWSEFLTTGWSESLSKAKLSPIKDLLRCAFPSVSGQFFPPKPYYNPVICGICRWYSPILHRCLTIYLIRMHCKLLHRHVQLRRSRPWLIAKFIQIPEGCVHLWTKKTRQQRP